MDKNTRKPFKIEKEYLLKKYKDNQLELEYNPSFEEWMFVTIRGIFDSKMYEHFHKQNDVSSITHFSEFVYSWLGSFCIDSTTREIR